MGSYYPITLRTELRIKIIKKKTESDLNNVRTRIEFSVQFDSISVQNREMLTSTYHYQELY